MPRSCFLFSEFTRSRSSLMETWLRDGAVCIQGVTSGIVHFSVCVPCEGIQNCVHGMAFTAPVFGHRALCFSVISHEIPFKWCLLSDLDAGCHYSPGVALQTVDRPRPSLPLPNIFPLFLHKVLRNSFTIYCVFSRNLHKFCRSCQILSNVHLARSKQPLRLLQPRAREPQIFRISHILQ